MERNLVIFILVIENVTTICIDITITSLGDDNKHKNNGKIDSPHSLDQKQYLQDCDATWDKHDKVVRRLCEQLGVEVVEKMSNTLWEPSKIIEANGGEPPHSYEMFMVSGL